MKSGWFFAGILVLVISASDQEATGQQFFLFRPNNIAMWVSNNGSKAISPDKTAQGIEWPKGSGNFFAAAVGTVWSGIAQGVLRPGGSYVKPGMQPGVILPNGFAADRNDPRFRIYHVRKGDTAAVDYKEWPFQDGAPASHDHTPILFGDEQIWYVMNDLDPSAGDFYGLTGIEQQVTVWSVNQPELLRDVLFFRERLIYRNLDDLEHFRCGIFTDFNIGRSDDDALGIDTLLRLGYTYNGEVRDSAHAIPPAIGVLLLKPHTDLYASVPALPPPPSPWFPTPGGIWLDHILWGVMYDGAPYINPLTGERTRFPFSGDPVARTGWVMDRFLDVRACMSIGPYTLHPRDTLDLEYAIIVGQALDNIQSVKKVQYIAKYIRTLYGLTSTTSVDEVPNLPASPHLHAPYPNPVLNPGTAVTIDFSVPDDDHVLLELYDAFGRRVVSIVDQQVQRGTHSISYKPDKALSSGVYHLVLRSNNRLSRQPLIIHR